MTRHEDWNKQTLTVIDIATIFRCGKNTVYNWIENKEIHSVKIGNTIRISMNVFEKWCKSKDFLYNKAEDFHHQVYTIDEIKEILNIGKNAAYDLLKESQFDVMQLGRIARISKKSFDDWLNKEI